jgi:hypothetical protein
MRGFVDGAGLGVGGGDAIGDAGAEGTGDASCSARTLELATIVTARKTKDAADSRESRWREGIMRFLYRRLRSSISVRAHALRS